MQSRYVQEIRRVPPAVEETSSSIPDQGNLMLVIEGEEVASRTSTESDHSSKREEVVAEGSSHHDAGEWIEGVFASPRDRGSAAKVTQIWVVRKPQPSSTEHGEIPSSYWKIFMAPTTSTIEFPIGDLGVGAPTKPIPLAALPNFHGLVSEDPDTFLFKFDIVCQGYDYKMEAQKLKFFPSTLKGTALRWFMGLGGSSISTWDDMRTTFLEKYQDYCKSWNIKEELFKFPQKEDESLEDCVEWFKYTLQRSGHSELDKEILKIILLRSFREDSMELLNIVGKGDISKESFEGICELCIQFSRGLARNRQGIHSKKGSGGGVMKAQIGNLLNNLRTYILSTLLAHMDTLQVK
jgi:hypothetical protein